MINLFSKINLILIFLLTVLLFSCTEKEDISTNCYEGTIIGKIRSAGGGPAVTLNSSDFGKHEWRGYENVVEALNLNSNYPSGTKIYFRARPATESEKSYIITADGDESAKPIIYVTDVSTETCPQVVKNN